MLFFIQWICGGKEAWKLEVGLVGSVEVPLPGSQLCLQVDQKVEEKNLELPLRHVGSLGGEPRCPKSETWTTIIQSMQSGLLKKYSISLSLLNSDSFKVLPCMWSLHIEGPPHKAWQLLGESASCRKNVEILFSLRQHQPESGYQTYIWQERGNIVSPIELWVFKLSLRNPANMETWLRIHLQVCM